VPGSGVSKAQSSWEAQGAGKARARSGAEEALDDGLPRQPRPSRFGLSLLICTQTKALSIRPVKALASMLVRPHLTGSARIKRSPNGAEQVGPAGHPRSGSSPLPRSLRAKLVEHAVDDLRPTVSPSKKAVAPPRRNSLMTTRAGIVGELHQLERGRAQDGRARLKSMRTRRQAGWPAAGRSAGRSRAGGANGRP